MPLAMFIDMAMRALDSGRDELHVGLTAVLQIGLCVAPTRFVRIVNAAASR